MIDEEYDDVMVNILISYKAKSRDICNIEFRIIKILGLF